MAFHFFLSLLPLIVFIGYVAGSLARKRGVAAVMAPLIDSVPAGTEALIKSQLGRLAGARADRLGPVAAFGFLMIASGGVHGLMNAVEQVIGARRRAWWRQRLLALAWVIGTLAVVGTASWAVITWDEMIHTGEARHPPAAAASSGSAEGDEGAEHAAASEPNADNESHQELEHVRLRPPAVKKRGRLQVFHSTGERVLALGLSLAGAVTGLAAFYRFSVTHSSRVKRRVLPGAFLAVVLWIVVTSAFSLYVRTLASYAVFYGSLAAVAVLLIWLWLVSLAILVGAELNSQLEGLRD
jgi:uncharacterized BrkB/YihY/UPF0761 family membrane protein